MPNLNNYLVKLYRKIHGDFEAGYFYAPYIPIIKQPQKPFTAIVEIKFNKHLINDSDAKFHMFYADKWGTEEAETVKDVDGYDVAFQVSGRESVVVGIETTEGHRADIVCVAIGLETAQYTNTKVTLTEGQNTIWMIAAEETLYADPMDPPDMSEKMDRKTEELDEKLITIFGGVAAAS